MRRSIPLGRWGVLPRRRNASFVASLSSRMTGYRFSGMKVAFTVVVALRQNGKNEESVPDSRFVIRIKRVYEKPTASDGSRILIDRVWPRGLKKSDLDLDDWLKEVAPSDRLRKWFGHDPRKWREFRRRYFAELRAKSETWAPILARAQESNVALLYGARDSEHNNATALKEFLTARLKE